MIKLITIIFTLLLISSCYNDWIKEEVKNPDNKLDADTEYEYWWWGVDF